MITPINSMSSYIKGIKLHKAARKVVNAANSSPKGMSKTPVRFDNDEFYNAAKAIAGGCIGTSAATCMSEFAQGCTVGSGMI